MTCVLIVIGFLTGRPGLLDLHMRVKRGGRVVHSYCEVKHVLAPRQDLQYQEEGSFMMHDRCLVDD